MDKAARKFFDSQSEEQKRAQQKSVDDASSEPQQRINLALSGKYLMEVPTFAWRDKNENKCTSPGLRVSERKKSLMLVISLKVADGVEYAPKGASTMTNIVISPAAGANQETIDNTMRLMKPRLAALLGHDNISITPEWIEQNLIPEFKEENNQFVLVRDHKLKQKVMVTVEDDVYENKPTLKVVQIVPAQPGDKSMPNVPTDQSQSGFAADEASSSDAEEFGEIDAAAAADTGGDSAAPATDGDATPATVDGGAAPTGSDGNKDLQDF